MNTGTRAAAFAAGLGVVFAAAFGLGALVQDDDATPAAAHQHDAFGLEVLNPPVKPGRATLRFRIIDRDGATVTRFDVRHEKELHLIVVDTGYAGYQHLHPTMAANGTWSVPMEVASGATRLYADFQPSGGQNAVATEAMHVDGTPAHPRYSLLRSQRIGAYTVTALGDLTTADTSRLSFEIGLRGVPVSDLQPYLGSYGHLVMLRAADGAYAHVHPEDGPAGPVVSFMANAGATGRYHLYFDFKHRGVVRTAHFVLDATSSEEGAGPGGMGMDHGDH